MLHAYSPSWEGPRPFTITSHNDDGTVNGLVGLDPVRDAALAREYSYTLALREAPLVASDERAIATRVVLEQDPVLRLTPAAMLERIKTEEQAVAQRKRVIAAAFGLLAAEAQGVTFTIPEGVDEQQVRELADNIKNDRARAEAEAVDAARDAEIERVARQMLAAGAAPVVIPDGVDAGACAARCEALRAEQDGLQQEVLRAAERVAEMVPGAAPVMLEAANSALADCPGAPTLELVSPPREPAGA